MLRIKYVEFVWKYTGEWYVFDTYQIHVKAMIYYCNINIWMEIEKSKVLIQFLLIFRQSGDVLFFLYARRLRGYTATVMELRFFMAHFRFFFAKNSFLNIFSVAAQFLHLWSKITVAVNFKNCGNILCLRIFSRLRIIFTPAYILSDLQLFKDDSQRKNTEKVSVDS